MKDYYIKEGGTKYQLAENAEDLKIKRYSVLKNIITEESSGMKMPDIIEWFASRRQYYNTGDTYSLLTSEINLAKQIEQNSKQKFNDASHRIFALIVSEEGEDICEYDSTKMDEKLERMALEGLTQKEVFSVTENFISVSPELYNSFFLMSLVAMTKKLKSSEPMLDRLLERVSPSELNTD